MFLSEKKKKCRQVSIVFIIYLSFFASATPTKKMQLGKLFRCFSEKERKEKKDFVLYEGAHKKTSQNFNPEFLFLSIQKIKWKKMEKEKRKLSYCSVIPSMWKYHSIMFWMFHVLIMLFSSLKASEENSSRNLNVDREDGSKKILQHREMLFISWGMKMKMSVRERDIRRFVSLLGYDSLLFHPFLCVFSIYDMRREGRD